MQNEHRFMARWKDILLYLGTSHLILHIGISQKNGGRGGGEASQEAIGKHTKTFISGMGTPGAQETSATHTRFF